MKFATLWLLIFGLVGCAGDDAAPSSDLDIVMTPTPAQDRSKPAGAAVEGPSQEIRDVVREEGSIREVTVDKDQTLNWQQFFSPPPNGKERSLLETRLSKWQESTDAGDLVEKAQAQIVLGKIAEAETTLNKALRIDGTNVQALLELAKLRLRHKRFRQAFEYLSEVKKTLDELPALNSELIFRYRYILALAYISSGNREKGHRALSDLLVLDRKFAPGYAALATSYLNDNQLEVAKFIAKRGIDSAGESAALLNVLGVIEYKNNRMTKARDYFTRALERSSSYGPALVNLANLSIRNFEFEAAEANLQKAIAFAPDQTTAHISMGILQRKTGRFQDAKLSFERALGVDPLNVVARFNLAVLSADKLSDPGKAMQLFHEVLQSESEENEIRTLAKLYIEDLKSAHSAILTH